MNSTYNWETDLKAISQLCPNESLAENPYKSYPQHFDDLKHLLDYSKSDRYRDTKFQFDSNHNGLSSTNSQDVITEKILNKILDNLVASSFQKDLMSKSNVINIITTLLQKQLTRQQYLKVQNVVLTIYGNSNNYYTGETLEDLKF